MWTVFGILTNTVVLSVLALVLRASMKNLLEISVLVTNDVDFPISSFVITICRLCLIRRAQLSCVVLRAKSTIFLKTHNCIEESTHGH